MNYEKRGVEIWCISTGKKVAEVTEDGEIRMEPYMSGPHGKWVREFLGSTGDERSELTEELPVFDPALGMNTPGLREYVEAKNLSAEETEALIKKLERR